MTNKIDIESFDPAALTAADERVVSRMNALADTTGDWAEHLPYEAVRNYFQPDTTPREDHAAHVNKCIHCQQLIETLQPSEAVLGELQQVAAEAASQMEMQQVAAELVSEMEQQPVELRDVIPRERVLRRYRTGETRAAIRMSTEEYQQELRSFGFSWHQARKMSGPRGLSKEARILLTNLGVNIDQHGKVTRVKPEAGSPGLRVRKFGKERFRGMNRTPIARAGRFKTQT